MIAQKHESELELAGMKGGLGRLESLLIPMPKNRTPRLFQSAKGVA